MADRNSTTQEQINQFNRGRTPLGWSETEYGPDASVHLHQIRKLCSISLALDNEELCDGDLSSMVAAIQLSVDRLEACLEAEPGDVVVGEEIVQENERSQSDDLQDANDKLMLAIDMALVMKGHLSQTDDDSAWNVAGEIFRLVSEARDITVDVKDVPAEEGSS